MRVMFIQDGAESVADISNKGFLSLDNEELGEWLREMIETTQVEWNNEF